MVHRIRPGEVEVFLGSTAHGAELFRGAQQLPEAGGQGGGVLLDEEAGDAVRHILGGAAAPDQHGGEAAGGGFPDHEAVGIEGGGEEEEVCPAVPGPEGLPVPDAAGEEAAVREAQLLRVLPDVGLVHAAAQEDHPEGLVPEGCQGVQNDADALVPHEAAHKEEAGDIFRQVIRSGDGPDFLRRQAAPGQVHAVGHHQVVSLIAQRPEVFPGAVADGPDLVAGADVLHQGADGALLQEPAPDGLGNVDVELRVVGEDDGGVYHVPELPGQEGGDDGAVGVKNAHPLLLQPGGQLRGEGAAGDVAQLLPGVKAGIAQHREGKGAVIRPGDGGGGHGDGVAPLRQALGVVHHGVGHAVDQRGEGIVQKADAGILAHKGSFQGQSALRVKVRETGLWSEWAKPVSITVASSTVTLPETRKPSTVRTYCPSW